MVRWHLRTAIEVCDWLKQSFPKEGAALFARLGITDERAAHWQDIVAKMYIPYDKERGILEQFDGFFKLKPLDLSHWQPRVANMDYILGHEETQHVMVIKQADIVMLMALLGEQFGSREERLRNWEFYSRVVDHGSSLSPATHSWVAARLDLIEAAYEMFIFAARIDLEDAKGNVHDGIHAATSGGIWQAVIFGFAGLALQDGTLEIEPKLPPHWKSVTFRVYHHGQQRTVRLTAEKS
jgi:kojibiose phosphorylase